MWSEVQKSKKILVIPSLTPNTLGACTAAAFSSCHEHTWLRAESLSNNVAWKLLTVNLLWFMFVAYLSREQIQEETNVSLRESDVTSRQPSLFSFLFWLQKNVELYHQNIGEVFHCGVICHRHFCLFHQQ